MSTHGTLVLLRQSKPTFQRSKLGVFDRGSRRFKCYSADVLHWLDSLFVPGRSDAITLAVVPGGTLAGHRGMFISSADVDSDLGETSIIRVDYEGLLLPKKAAVEFSTSSEEQSIIPVAEANFVFVPVRLDAPVPTVAHRWVSSKGRPSAVTPGTPMKPPGITDAETERTAAYYDDFLPNQVTLFEGWILQNRTMRAPGDCEKHSHWEVADTYQFVVKRATLP